MHKLPEFFAVGPPRTATTWLHEVLTGHVNLPRIVKEPRFFDLRYSKGLAWHRRHFEPIFEGLPIGEISPTYFYSIDAIRRIAQLTPQAKILITLRDPVKRLYSLYKMKVGDGTIRMSFKDAVRRHPEMIESNRYEFYIRKWIGTFGEKQTLVIMQEELLRDAGAYLDKVCRFIGIPPFEVSDAEGRRRSNSADEPCSATVKWLSAIAVRAADSLNTNNFARTMAVVRKLGVRKLFLRDEPVRIPPLDPEFAEQMRREMRPQIESLEVLLNTDLSAWKPRSS
ncbi:MAG: sulfotransferase [Candidatus Binataceae bacterium]|nr:sulfotransferase [Candidatus Binataceae bacterium]